MSDEVWKTLAIVISPLAVLLGRIWSRSEHKQTGRDVAEIKIFINGEMEKKLEQAREEGRQEEKQKRKTKN